MPGAAHEPAEQLLEEGRPVERMLGGGERQEYRVVVEAGWYVRLEIEQIGVDVAASLLGPDGATLFSTDDPDGIEDKEILEVIAPTTGELRLVVTPHNPQDAPGTYRAALTARRLAGPGDVERTAARKAISEASRLGNSLDEPKRREEIRLYQEAVRLWETVGEIGEECEALNEIGILQNTLSENQAALASFQRALSLAQESGDLKWEAFARSNLAGISGALDDLQRLEHYERALALFEKLGTVGEQARVLYGMGIIYRDQGDLDKAFRYFSEALPLRSAARDASGELKTLTALAGVQLGRGEMEKASASLDRALELSRSGGWEGGVSVLSTLAQFQRYRGDLEDALVRLQEARELYHRTGNEDLEARTLQHLGVLYLDLGNLDAAQRSYEEGLALVAGKNAEGEARFLNNLGWTVYLRGDSRAALDFFNRALALAREKNLPAVIPQALWQTGVVFVGLGRTREGLNLLQEELALRQKNGDRVGEAWSLLEIGGAWQALGDLDRAEASFREALDLGRRMGNTGLRRPASTAGPSSITREVFSGRLWIG